MTIWTKDTASKILETVIDPAFDVDIVSLRFIKNIEIEGDKLLIHTELPTHAYDQPLRDSLSQRITQALTSKGAQSVTVLHEVQTAYVPPSSEKAILKGPKNVIAVAAGKGGVGKSTVATNLALSLRKYGASVGLLDADVFGPSIPQMLGQPQKPAGTKEDKTIVPAVHHGIKVISVGFFVDRKDAVVWRGPMVHRLLQQFLQDVDWGPLDYLICDLPPGTGDVQLSLSQLIPISGSVMVTTPQEVSIIDVVKGISMFEKVEIPILGIVENMSHYTCPACGHDDEIFSRGGGKRLAKELDVDFLGDIPIDTRIRFGGDSGVPISIAAPDAVHSQTFMSIAQKVAFAVAKPIISKPKVQRRLAVIR